MLKDLLISVTNFFRDKQAFNALEQDVLPRLLHDKHADAPLRIWVIGCATGEEAYSLAMLCAERTLDLIDAPKVQIFATDIDETAITHAREGIYTINDAADVSPERLRRFFTKEGSGYRVRPEIREMVLFAYHNVLKDPPFSHLDLVSCRNMLIYLNATAQARVMETVHFALNPGGYVFLGTSESADSANSLYSIVSREHHIYQSRSINLRSYPVPEAVPNPRVSNQSPAALPATRQEQRVLSQTSVAELHQQLLEQYAPPSIVVDRSYAIVHISERAGRYLRVGGGEPSNNLLKLIRPELRVALRTTLYQALQRHATVETRNVAVRIDHETETVNIIVHARASRSDTTNEFLLVIFAPSNETHNDVEVVPRSNEPLMLELEEELMRGREQLRLSNEQHEFQAEELKAANEELQAMNEELRSAAEELETSKEELQSINEELRTVNQELKVKIEETTQASTMLRNLVNSTDVGTIFLDRGFRVVLFTPTARTIFNLIPADYGRLLSDITNRLVDVDVIHDVEIVLEKLQMVEREVHTSDNRHFLMRVLPYRTAEDYINGVVITFLDITDRKQAEAQP